MSNPIKKLGKAVSSVFKGVGKIFKKLGPVIILAAIVIASIYTGGAAMSAMGPAGAIGTAPAGVAYGGAVAAGGAGAAGAAGASAAGAAGASAAGAAGVASAAGPAGAVGTAPAGLAYGGAGSAALTAGPAGAVGTAPAGLAYGGVVPTASGETVAAMTGQTTAGVWGSPQAQAWNGPSALGNSEVAAEVGVTAELNGASASQTANTVETSVTGSGSPTTTSATPSTEGAATTAGEEAAKEGVKDSLWTKTKDFAKENPLLAYGGMQMAGNLMQALGEEDEKGIHPDWGDTAKVRRAYANATGAGMGVAKRPTATLLDPKTMKKPPADFSDPTATFDTQIAAGRPVQTQTFTSGAAQAVPEPSRRRSLLDVGGQNA